MKAPGEIGIALCANVGRAVAGIVSDGLDTMPRVVKIELPEIIVSPAAAAL